MLKKYIFPVIVLCNISNIVLAASSYIQLCSTDSQTITNNKSLEVPQKATLSTQDNNTGGVLSWSKKNPNIITVKKTGVYFLMTTAQVGATPGVNFKDANIAIWYTLNGKAINDSANWVYLSAQSGVKIIVSQMAMKCKKCDEIGLMYSTDSLNSGLVAYSNSGTFATAPSLTVTMYEI